MKYIKKGLVFSLAAAVMACAACRPRPTEVPAGTDPVSGRWKEIGTKFKNVNALYAAYISPGGQVLEYKQGKTVQNRPVDENTLFEGASLSKTYFAYMFWNMLLSGKTTRDSIPIQKCTGTGSLSFSPFELLSHTAQLPGDTCAAQLQQRGLFAYSENCYLALQREIEKRQGKNLQDMAEEIIFIPGGFMRSSFVWLENDSNYVDGYYTSTEYHRAIHKYIKPAANGSLYLTGREYVAFVKKLMESPELDSMRIPFTQVQGYPSIRWGRGIGLEENKGDTYAWQWASNWSFKSFLLINTKDKSAFLCLTNSASGAEAIRGAAEWLLDTQFETFDYLGW